MDLAGCLSLWFVISYALSKLLVLTEYCSGLFLSTTIIALRFETSFLVGMADDLLYSELTNVW